MSDDEDLRPLSTVGLGASPQPFFTSHCSCYWWFGGGTGVGVLVWVGDSKVTIAEFGWARAALYRLICSGRRRGGPSKVERECFAPGTRLKAACTSYGT